MIKIEKGLTLYSLMYFFGERNFRQFTINKISKNKNGTFLISKEGMRLKLEEIGDTWFSTKDECYLKSFMNHVMARKYHDGLDKEYKFLKNKVKEMYFRDKPIDLIEEALIDYAKKVQRKK